MNSRQKRVQQVHLDNEKKVLRQLKQVYSRASQDCAEKIRELNSRTDMQNLQTIIYQRQYQEALKKQLDGILDTLQNNQFSSIADYLGTSYEDGFIGTLYDLQGQGIPLIFPIDESQVVKALQADTKLSNSLYKSLGEDVDYLKKSIKAELSRGISNGSSWLDIAAHIANGMNSPFNKALNRSTLIARTEGHRIQNQAALDCQHKAKDKGADVLKQWDSTLDKRTRKAHVEADGQIVELDEYFSVGGEEMSAPGVGGTAKNVCNCRCCLLQRARWALSDTEYTKMNGDTNELVKLEESDYTKFKHKAKDIMNQQTVPKGLDDCKTYDDLSKYLSKKYGISVDGSVKDLDYDTVVKALGGAERIMKEYPDVAKNIERVTTSKSGVMSCSGKTITFNPAYFKDTANLQQSLEDCAKSGWWVKNATADSIGAHEAAHGVEWALIQNNKNYSYDFMKTIAWNDCEEAKIIVSQACKNIKKTPYGKGKVNDVLKGAISGYAKSNASETMAEAFADVYANGENASPLSIEIKRLTEEQMKKYKGGA